ncbi:MAG: hypothetical protein ACRDQU_05340 [Pseudonocardiaceae bacterium]
MPDTERSIELREELVGEVPGRVGAIWPEIECAGNRAGRTWLIYVDGQPAATLTLGWSDPLWDDDGAAGYLHRLSAPVRCRSRLAFAELGGSEVGRRHRQWLRLDCVALNRRLCQYYESHGFRHRGTSRSAGQSG